MRQGLPKYVHFIPRKEQYKVCVYTRDHIQQYLGYYKTIEEAREVRDTYCREHNIVVREHNE